jgi:hypothetical protein
VTTKFKKQYLVVAERDGFLYTDPTKDGETPENYIFSASNPEEVTQMFEPSWVSTVGSRYLVYEVVAKPVTVEAKVRYERV